MQEVYLSKYGRIAKSVAELEQEFPNGIQISQPYELSVDGTNWQVVVPKTEYLAGGYRLVSSGAIFFHENRIPTTNDIALKTRWR